MKRDYWLYLVASACGAAIWAFVAVASGKREAWDSGLYFSVGTFGFLEPRRPWRWGVAPVVGQLVWMLLTQGPGNLLPLGVVVFGFFSLPSIVAAWVGAVIATKRSRPEGGA